MIASIENEFEINLEVQDPSYDEYYIMSELERLKANNEYLKEKLKYQDEILEATCKIICTISDNMKLLTISIGGILLIITILALQIFF